MVQVQETFMADSARIWSSAALAMVAMTVVLALDDEPDRSSTTTANIVCLCLDIFSAVHAFSYLAHGHPFLVRLMGLISLLVIYDGWKKPSTSKAASLCLGFLWAGQALEFSKAARPVYLAAAHDGSASLQQPGPPWQAEGCLCALSCGLFSVFLMVRLPLSAHR